MKKKILFIITIVFVQTLLTGFVFAQNQGASTPDSGGTGGISNPQSSTQTVATLQNPLKVNSIGEAVDIGIQYFTYLAILAAVLALVWVGFQFIWARGKPEKIKDAGKWLGYILIGIAIILGARLMVSIILETLKSTGALDPNVINSANQAIQRAATK